MPKIKHSITAFLAFIKAKYHIFITVLVIAFFVIQYLQISSMTGGVSSLSMRGSSLVNEVSKLNQVVSVLGQDLNEVRGFLVMPTRKYNGSDEVDSVEADSNQDALQLALFKYVSFVGEQEKLAQKTTEGLASLKSLSGDKDLKGYLVANKLVMTGVSESAKDWHVSVSNEKKYTIIYLALDKETGVLNLKIIDSVVPVSLLDGETLASYIKTYLEQKLTSIVTVIQQLEDKKSYIVKSLQNEAIAQIFKSQKLVAGLEPTTQDYKFYYQIKNESKEIVAEIVLDKKDLSIQLKDARDSDKVAVKVTDLVSAIPPFIEKLDTIPEVQKKVLDAKAKIGETFDDKGFKLLLKNLNLSISNDAREDEYRYYYDIFTVLTGKTKLLGSIVIEKATGAIDVVDPKGTSTTNILFFDPGLKKKL